MKIAIIGGGFAGRAAAKTIGGALGGGLVDEIVLIDRHSYTTMLPSLPDLAGDRVREKDLVESIAKLIPSCVQFMEMSVAEVDFNQKIIHFTDGTTYAYDKLIFAPGSKTNFYGNKTLPDTAYKMDCLDDSLKIRKDAEAFLNTHEEVNFVVSGAGFTGIELANNLYHMAKTMNRPAKITIVEVTNKVLPMLSDKMSAHVKRTVESLGITFLLEKEVISYENDTVSFKDGTSIPNAFYCWCAGVMTSIPSIGNHQETRDKRIMVDEYLRIPEHPDVFVAGDAAAAKDKNGQVLRRALYFSASEGKTAGENLVRSIKNQSMKPFNPFDPGWIIPLYVNSVGESMGMSITGRIGISMHYFLCGYYNYSLRNFADYLGYSGRFTFTRPK